MNHPIACNVGHSPTSSGTDHYLQPSLQLQGQWQRHSSPCFLKGEIQNKPNPSFDNGSLNRQAYISHHPTHLERRNLSHQICISRYFTFQAEFRCPTTAQYHAIFIICSDGFFPLALRFLACHRRAIQLSNNSTISPSLQSWCFSICFNGRFSLTLRFLAYHRRAIQSVQQLFTLSIIYLCGLFFPSR